MTENQNIQLRGFLPLFLKLTETSFSMLTLAEQSLSLQGKVGTMSIAGKRHDRS